MIHVNEERNRMDRILFLYDKLIAGDTVYKSEMAAQFDVHERTIRRDIQEIKYYVARFYISKDVIYDRRAGGYKFINGSPHQISWRQWCVLLKIIFDNHVLSQQEGHQLMHSVALLLRRDDRQSFFTALRHTVNRQIKQDRKMSSLSDVELVYDAIARKRKIQITRGERDSIWCPIGVIYKHPYFFIAALSDDSFHQNAANHLEPVPIILREELSIEITAQYFSLPVTFSFDEEAFNQRCRSS
ncbi:MAG: hypothetical protein ABF586_10340 [Sporolactobacillus sp.]